MGRKITTEDWIITCKTVHGDRYDYSKSVYTKALNKITITCPEHGDFEQLAINHSRGFKCVKCGKTQELGNRLVNDLAKKFKGLVQPEDYKLIPLTKGKFAKVDNEDFDRVSKIN